METLYYQTNNIILEVQQYFQQLSSLRATNSDTSLIEQKICSSIDTASRNCERLDILVQKEPVGKRPRDKIRVDQLKYDVVHLQAALRNYYNEVNRKKKEEEERNQLLSRRFTHNAAAHDTTIFIDHSINHHNSLQNANRGVDELIHSGSSILENLRDQRGTLKNAQRRLMDIANTLGLSNTTMRLIEKRAREDKFIFYGGILTTLIVMGLVVMYVF